MDSCQLYQFGLGPLGDVVSHSVGSHNMLTYSSNHIPRSDALDDAFVTN